MFDQITPYELHFIQKASPLQGDAFDFSYIYKFYTERTDDYQRLKYIVRVESHESVFAIKFYAARDRKLDRKYNRIIKANSYTATLRIFITCAHIVPTILEEFPNSSFVINGARTMDLESGKIEGENSNQRFRIYRRIALQMFGRITFEHFEFIEVSSYLLVNKSGCMDVNQKKDEIKSMFLDRYEVYE